jgi:hypothetical protein
MSRLGGTGQASLDAPEPNAAPAPQPGGNVPVRFRLTATRHGLTRGADEPSGRKGSVAPLV